MKRKVLSVETILCALYTHTHRHLHASYACGSESEQTNNKCACLKNLKYYTT